MVGIFFKTTLTLKYGTHLSNLQFTRCGPLHQFSNFLGSIKLFRNCYGNVDPSFTLLSTTICLPNGKSLFVQNVFNLYAEEFKFDFRPYFPGKVHHFRHIAAAAGRPFKCYVTLFFCKLDPHPPPRNVNNIEHYTFVTLFSRKSDTTHPHLRYVTLYTTGRKEFYAPAFRSYNLQILQYNMDLINTSISTCHDCSGTYKVVYQ